MLLLFKTSFIPLCYGYSNGNGTVKSTTTTASNIAGVASNEYK